MSEIKSNKAGLDPETYQEGKDLLAAWDGGGTGESLTLDYAGRGKFNLWTQRPGYMAQLIYIGTRAAAFAYIRGMIHGKQGRINL
jgi:hypothetical protein